MAEPVVEGRRRARRRGVRVRCPLGGYALCWDDLCRGGGETLCGLEIGYDVCWHSFIPETCPDCGEHGDDERFDDF